MSWGKELELDIDVLFIEDVLWGIGATCELVRNLV